MPDIVVIRGAGDSQGPDITDPLLTTDHACMARGIVELDDGSPKVPVRLSVLYRDGLLLGQVVEVSDPLYPTKRYGKITGISHTLFSNRIETVLVVSIKSDFYT